MVDQIAVPREGPAPQAIPLSVLYEDDAIVVVDKPAGMIVHPAKGHWEGTLASALAHHFGPLSGRGGPTRPGIVHRLDRDTSGVIVVAKNDQAHDALAAQFKSREVEKEYLAIVVGVPDRDRDVIDEPIGPHPTQREKKAIRRAHPDARPAVTVYEVVERFAGFALVRARPKTGRTHQIRIHLAHIGCPVLCDRLYGGRAKISELELIPKGKIGQDISTTDVEPEHPLLERQALHAHRLALTHPTTGERMQFEAFVPPDMENTLAALRRWRRHLTTFQRGDSHEHDSRVQEVCPARQRDRHGGWNRHRRRVWNGREIACQRHHHAADWLLTGKRGLQESPSFGRNEK